MSASAFSNCFFEKSVFLARIATMSTTRRPSGIVTVVVDGVGRVDAGSSSASEAFICFCIG